MSEPVSSSGAERRKSPCAAASILAVSSARSLDLMINARPSAPAKDADAAK